MYQKGYKPTLTYNSNNFKLFKNYLSKIKKPRLLKSNRGKTITEKPAKNEKNE